MKHTTPLFILILLLQQMIVAQQTSSFNNTAVPFLLISTDAKSGGIADIGVATPSDPNAIYHNPAKIAFAEKQGSIALNYTPWLRNLTNDIFVGNITYISKFRENAAWGVDMKYFALGKIDLRDNNANLNAIENPNELAITGSYALQLSDHFSMGIALKYIHSNFKINTASTNINTVNSFATDISGFYQSEETNYGNFNGIYRLGFNITNIGPKVEYTPGNPNFIPTNLKLGAGFDFIMDPANTIALYTEFQKLLIPSNPNSKNGWIQGIFSSLGDDNFQNELKEIAWAIGTAYNYNNAFAIRTGYFHESQEKGNRQYFTVGTSFKTNVFTIDISYLINTSEVNNPLENTLKFSLAYEF